MAVCGGGGGISRTQKRGTRNDKGIMNSSILSLILCGVSRDEEIRAHVESSTEKANQKAAEEEKDPGTKNAQSEASWVPSIPILAKLLGDGLCGDSDSDALQIVPGVSFKRSEHKFQGKDEKEKIFSVRNYFNMSSMFNPEHIKVELGKTKAEIDGKQWMVESFDHGECKLKGRESKIKQLQLLEISVHHSTIQLVHDHGGDSLVLCRRLVK